MMEIKILSFIMYILNGVNILSNLHFTSFTTRNPNAHLRPNFQAILESLQKDKHSLLDWKDADMMGSEAATLGAPLQYGASLYPDLQKRYKD